VISITSSDSHLPDSLIREPSGIALVVSVIVGGLQLGRSGDGSAVLDAGGLRLLKVQGVAGGDGPVVEHNTYGDMESERATEEL